MSEPTNRRVGLGDDPRLARLLREATEWRLIGLLFECPSGAWWSDVASLAASCGDPQLRSAGPASEDATEGAYFALLGPSGLASPREVGHRTTADPGQHLSALAALYGAFAYRPASEEPPDHVAVEAGFVGYLLFKEAYAAARGDSEAAAVTAEASARFIESHLSTYAEPLAEALEASGVEHLRAASRALLSRTGPRRHVEGGWAPEGLCAGGCPMPGEE